jgi:hypothetical protein
MLVVVAGDGLFRLRRGPHVARADLAQHIGSGGYYGIQALAFVTSSRRRSIVPELF